MANNDKTPIKITLAYVSDDVSHLLNQQYRHLDYPTDVLSFNLDQEDPVEGVYLLGEVVVNLDQAQRQAKELGHSVEEEVGELVRHGVLHLMGVHHEEDL